MPLAYHIAGVDQPELVLGLIQQAFEEYRGRLDPPSGAFDETLESVSTAMRAGGAALAYDARAPVATALFEPHGNFLYVGRVSVIPAQRGRGIARGLMVFLESQARLLDLTAVEIGVRESLPSNVALYRSLGYHVVASEPHPRNPSFNSLTMRKDV